MTAGADLEGYEQVGDYAYIKKGKEYWNIYHGNPFMLSYYKIPLDRIDRQKLIESMESWQLQEKHRWKKEFPEQEWEEKP